MTDRFQCGFTRKIVDIDLSSGNIQKKDTDAAQWTGGSSCCAECDWAHWILFFYKQFSVRHSGNSLYCFNPAASHKESNSIQDSGSFRWIAKREKIPCWAPFEL